LIATTNPGRRCGAGLVTLAVPRSIQATIASFEPSYMTLSFGAAGDDSLRQSWRLFGAEVGVTHASNCPGLGRGGVIHLSEIVEL
jgi:NAD(P)H-hydrate repair Nnr-like enzyme with NAD(P)H-hydrate dehydratase domain